jgi:methionyl-tRNA synthetase
MLAHVVTTVHGTEKLLVPQELCAHSHFLYSVGGMSSSFENIVLVSSVLKRKKCEVNLYVYTFMEKLAGCIYRR